MKQYSQQLMEDVLALALPQGRVIGSAGHARARQHITERMLKIGLLPYKGESVDMPYTSGGDVFHNLIGVVPGRDRSAPPVLIGAHYDSVITAPCLHFLCRRGRAITFA